MFAIKAFRFFPWCGRGVTGWRSNGSVRTYSRTNDLSGITVLRGGAISGLRSSRQANATARAAPPIRRIISFCCWQ
jgi:hypothetical protein